MPPARDALGALVALALFAVSVGGCGPAPETARARHVLLITVDTWRGDHLSQARAGTELTPRLDAWLDRAHVFTQAYSVGAETSPGVAGILTGLLPHRSGVLRNSHVLPEGVPTTASLLRDAGFATAGWVANPVLREGVGFDSGFDSYELTRRESEGRADRLLARVATWLDERPAGERTFAWAHLMEPHGPYWAPEEERRLFPVASQGERRDLPQLPEGDNTGAGGLPYYQWSQTEGSPTDAREYLALYAAGVHWLDRALGDFLEELDRAGAFEDTVVVLTSDHGEALAGDNGYFFSHSNDLTPDQLHVPLAVWMPGSPGARPTDRPASTLDVLPTICGALGLAAPAHADGVDLFGDAASLVMCASQRELALREGAWMLRTSRTGEPVELTERTAAGSWEVRDAAGQTERTKSFRQRLAERLAAPALARPSDRTSTKTDVEDLHALGYTE